MRGGEFMGSSVMLSSSGTIIRDGMHAYLGSRTNSVSRGFQMMFALCTLQVGPRRDRRRSAADRLAVVYWSPAWIVHAGVAPPPWPAMARNAGIVPEGMVAGYPEQLTVCGPLGYSGYAACVAFQDISKTRRPMPRPATRVPRSSEKSSAEDLSADSRVEAWRLLRTVHEFCVFF